MEQSRMKEDLHESFDIAPQTVAPVEAPTAAAETEATPASKPILSELSSDLAAGLSANPKTIPSKYLYDAVGSALFEAICQLREYKCSRAEKRLLSANANQVIDGLAHNTLIVELGGGSGEKAELLLKAIPDHVVTAFHDIDISQAALTQARTTLSAYPHVRFIPHATDYLSGLEAVSRRRADNQPLLLMFLGSSIGNFERAQAEQFLRSVGGMLRAGDRLLLGTDLVKPMNQLIAAYDDPQGVTAAFNKNVLARINAELGGNFNLAAFRHQARWNVILRRVEMHLVSSVNQNVEIPGAAMIVRLKKGESIHTESSHKYRADEIGPWLGTLGYSLEEQWIDRQALFATNLLSVA
jgi:L-histidine N-alpha-methyltransferase